MAKKTITHGRGVHDEKKKTGENRVEDRSGRDIEELSATLDRVQAKTVEQIDNLLSKIDTRLKDLDLAVVTEDRKATTAQAVSGAIQQQIEQLDRILNTTDNEDYKAVIEAKKDQLNKRKATADNFIAKNVSDEDRVTPPGSTDNPIYTDAKKGTFGFRRKF